MSNISSSKQGCQKETRSPSVGFFHAWWQDLDFRFYRTPKQLVEGEEYQGLSADAIMLYSFLLDRAYLSVKNPGFFNGAGSAYVIYTNEEICRKLRCGHEKASRLLKELENYDLIYVDRSHRKSMANQIYIQPFIRYRKDAANDDDTSDSSDIQISSEEPSEKQLPGDPENSTAEVLKSDANDTDRINNDTNDTDYFCDVWSYDEIRDRVKSWIGYDVLAEKETYQPYLDTAVEVMTDTLSSRKDVFRIGKETIPKRNVFSRLCQIDQVHMAFVLESLIRMEEPVRNPRAFLLTQLYYAPVNIHRLSSDVILADLAKETSAKEVMVS